jgi:hypothetical protein
MEAMASPPAQADPASASTNSPLSLAGLPREIQAEIMRHCEKRDLVCVALVSKHFHELASAELYREFHIIFPDEENPQFDGPVDALASALDTFATSDYNYPRNMRKLVMDTLYMGDKAAVAYGPYLSNLSCGKFMNTLLVITLRKAHALETFK